MTEAATLQTPPRRSSLERIIASTLALTLFHAGLAAFHLEVLRRSGDIYVTSFLIAELPKPMFLDDVLNTYDFLMRHMALSWACCMGAVALEGAFYFYLRLKDDRTLGRVWSILISVFLLVIVIGSYTTLMLARHRLMLTGFIAQ